MKLMKWLLVFIVAFIVAAILIFTFIQEPFRQLVGARILTWRTPAVPIYAYVAGAFGIGLLFGLGTTLYYFILLQARVHHKNRAIDKLETQLSDARRVLEMNGLLAADTDGSAVVPADASASLPAPAAEHNFRQHGGAA